MTAQRVQREPESRARRRILLTGASGYVGGRLLPRLEQRDFAVRCLARRPEFLARRVGPHTQVVEADALRAETLPAAVQGLHAAYYLIHSMGNAASAGFEQQDRLAAENFGRAARVRRIDDLLAYLEAALDLETDESRVYEIGGAERVSYGELMKEYARQCGLRRWMISVPEPQAAEPRRQHVHAAVFRGMLAGIARAARRDAERLRCACA